MLLYADRPGTSTIPGNREITVNFSLYGIGALVTAILNSRDVFGPPRFVRFDMPGWQ